MSNLITTVLGAIILPIVAYIGALFMYKIYYWIAGLLNFPGQHYIAIIGATVFIGVVLGFLISWFIDSAM